MGYYYISIGGSGAKVMESLTHLTAAGLLPNREKEEKLYVLAVDPDVGNGNLSRSSAALHNLVGFQDIAVGTDTELLKTKVEIANPFPWNPTEHDKKLDDIMAYQTHKGTALGDLYETLYTHAERSTFLNEGFRGRPSIGAAVLARKAAMFSKKGWEDNADAPWNKFSRMVKDDAKNGRVAKIFIGGSVFGGTGAAGMPTIARLLREEFSDYCAQGQVVIGGAFILPYFSFTPTQTDGQIFASSENFLTNTKAALKYYYLQSKKGKIYDSMYFIGDSISAPVKRFSVGAATQTNDAHIVDFYAALAAVDFFGAKEVKECSYISHQDDTAFKWTDFPDAAMVDGTSVRIKDRLGQFVRMIFFYQHMVKPVLKELAAGRAQDYKYPWFIDYLAGIDVDTSEIKEFDEYAERFIGYLAELEGQDRTDSRRTVELVDVQSFDAQTTPATISATRFERAIYGDEGALSLHDIWANLAEHPAKDNVDARGFGRFIRALYDCCVKA